MAIVDALGTKTNFAREVRVYREKYAVDTWAEVLEYIHDVSIGLSID